MQSVRGGYPDASRRILHYVKHRRTDSHDCHSKETDTVINFSLVLPFSRLPIDRTRVGIIARGFPKDPRTPLPRPRSTIASNRASDRPARDEPPSIFSSKDKLNFKTGIRILLGLWRILTQREVARATDPGILGKDRRNFLYPWRSRYRPR